MTLSTYTLGDTVYYAPFQPQYKELLKRIRKWHAEEWIDPEIMTNTTSVFNNKLRSGEVGSTYYYNRLSDKTTGCTWIGAPLPKLNQGDKSRISYVDPVTGTGQYAISAKTQYPTEALRWLDFWFSDQGALLMNYGIEGESYYFDNDGNPQFTGMIMNPPVGQSRMNWLSEWAATVYAWPGITIPDANFAFRTTAEMVALRLWNEVVNENIPIPPAYGPIEPPSYNETDLSTYFEEMLTAFFLGTKDIDAEFDGFVANLRKLGAEELVARKQQALNEFFASIGKK